MNHSKVSRTSVIVPAYNMESSVGRAVESVLRQDPPPLQVIVVDDGSIDNTAAAAQSSNASVMVIQQPNAGEAAARNRGMEQACGEFIAFLDADDYWLPGFLQACEQFLDHHDEAIAVSVGLRYKHFAKADTIFPDATVHPELFGAQPFVIPDFFPFWGKYDHIRVGSSLFRRSILMQTGGMLADLKISPDLEYWAYTGTFGKWGFIPEIYWVCDSETEAVKAGWLKKNHSRRRHCPTVEQWQRRVLTRLRDQDWVGFKGLRGRVAASFAQNHILARRFDIARNIVTQFGPEMPPVWSSDLLRTAARFGKVSWFTACLLLCVREYQKASLMSLRLKLATAIHGANPQSPVS